MQGNDLRLIAATALGLLVIAGRTQAVVTPPSGYIYGSQLLGSLTQSCVAVGPGGTFVGIGPGFSANAQAVVFAQESGTTRLVAFGFSSIGDCAYDKLNDVLYVSDNGGELSGALIGDTVFRIPAASTASALSATDIELVPGGSVPFAANLAVDSSGDVYVSNSAGSDSGSVIKIDLPGTTTSTFASPFDFTAGLAFDPSSGDLLVAESRDSFDAQISRFSSTGTFLSIFTGPSFSFGSYDLAYNTDGRLIATGAFAGDVVSFDASGTPSTFVSGLNFANGVTIDDFTGRVEILSSFSGTDEDRSIHRFTPIDRLVPGRGSADTECVHEFYGVALVPPAPGEPARRAICEDGDSCDADGKKNGRCLFPVGFCLNVPDPNFATCSASSDVVTFEASAKPDTLAMIVAAAALQETLPSTTASCFFSDGISIPIKTTRTGAKSGKGKVRVEAVRADGSVDRDVLTLVCTPAP